MLDQYQLLDRIGVGGMAEVWRATMRGAEGFERQIAIKRILPHFSGDTDFVAMFVDEAKIAVRLSHPNIVQIFDLGRVGSEWFIAMEYVHGKDVRAVIDAEAARGQRVPLEVACHVVMKMCEALQHAHFLDGNPLDPHAARQVIHRDVSPQNVLVSYEGEVKVADFGLAKAAGRAAHTQAGTIKGKLAYMSPEQLRGVTLDQRSDVFAVGIVLWELLAGDRLFLGENDRDTITKAFACRVPSLVELDPTLDPELERIARRALAENRDERFQTAEELREELESFVYGAGLHLSSGSLAAYMQALFPSSKSSRRRDPRAATTELRLPPSSSTVELDEAAEAEDVEEFDELEELELVESEPPPGPQARPAPEREGSTGLDEAEDFADATMMADSDFAALELEAARQAHATRAAQNAGPTFEEPFDDGTLALEPDALAALGIPRLGVGSATGTGVERDPREASFVSEPPDDLVVTRMTGPSARDLAASRPLERREGVSATVPRAPSEGYGDFGSDDETTNSIGRRR